MSATECTSGMGLLLHDSARGQIDKYFESFDSPVPIHSNIYINANDQGEATLNGAYVDQVDDMFLIFDRDEIVNEYPFENVSLVLSNGAVIWTISSECLKLLEGVGATGKKTNNLPQIIIRLPLWLSKVYNTNVPFPEKIKKIRQSPFLTYGNDIKCQISPPRAFTLGAHVTMLCNETRKKAISSPVDIPIDVWENDNYTFNPEPNCSTTEVVDISNSLVDPPVDSPVGTTTKIRFPSRANLILTDIMFVARDIHGNTIPIKYLRAFHQDIEILSINTSQLQYASNNASNIYLYSHLPGKLCVSKLKLSWEVELFSPQSYASVHVYPRTWNIMKLEHKKIELLFGNN